VKVDGRKLFAGEITCLLVGNMSELAAGIAAFEGSRPDDGIVEVGVVTAKSALGWVRTLARAVLGTAQASPFVETLRGSSIRVAFDHPTAYELDGGVRGTTDHMRIKVRPGAITVCVPPEAAPTPEPEAAADP
jgi:diacylglycerol kinase family enzyme